jgi:hypothetical protein
VAGYSNYSMSNNALDAYQRGLVPASKIKGVPGDLIRAHCTCEEWHHSSKAFNIVEFYDPAVVRATFGLEALDGYDANPRAVAALAQRKTSKAVTHSNCTVRWLEWSGSFANPKCTQRESAGCTVTVKGQTATVKIPTGLVFTKRLTTRGFYFQGEKA